MCQMSAEVVEFNIDILSWNVSNVRSTRTTFHFPLSFNQDITCWKVDNTASMQYMLTGAPALQINIFQVLAQQDSLIKNVRTFLFCVFWFIHHIGRAFTTLYRWELKGDTCLKEVTPIAQWWNCGEEFLFPRSYSSVLILGKWISPLFPWFHCAGRYGMDH